MAFFIFESSTEITYVPSMRTYQSKLRIMPDLAFKSYFFWFWDAWFYFVLHFGQMIVNLSRVALKGVKDDIAQIYLFITMLLKYIKTLSIWLNRIPLGNELYSPADLRLIALNTSGLTLPETTVCTKLCRLLPLQNRASLISAAKQKDLFPQCLSPRHLVFYCPSKPTDGNLEAFSGAKCLLHPRKGGEK